MSIGNGKFPANGNDPAITAARITEKRQSPSADDRRRITYFFMCLFLSNAGLYAKKLFSFSRSCVRTRSSPKR